MRPPLLTDHAELDATDPLFELELELLLEAIYHRYHCDFRSYSRPSLTRRLKTTLQVQRCSSLSELQARLLHEPQLFSTLLNTLTVQVSDLFRDPVYFLALRAHVVPILRTYPSLKIWIAGCSSGEEAYSLAILLAEEGLLDRSLLYATDINPRALLLAESGGYELARLPGFTINHDSAGGRAPLSHYYTTENNRAVFSAALRDHIVWSDHSLATDSAFAEVHLVSCRNVLIYFNRQLQDRTLGLFLDSLCHRGFLGIGAKESVQFSSHAAHYTEFLRAARIYRKAT